MKKLLAVLFAVLCVCAFLCACGKEEETEETKEDVTTTVAPKYDDGYARKYAGSVSTDENGNIVYEFTGDQYDRYLADHKNTIGKDAASELKIAHTGTDDQAAKYGQYAFVDDEKNAVVIGVEESEYDEAAAKEESKIAAEYGFKYFQNLKDPVDTIKVIYCNAGNQDVVYGEFEYTAN